MSPEEQKDRQIAEGIKKRSEKAFALLVDEYGGLMKGIVSYHLKNTAYCEECLNDCLLSVWQNMKSYDSGKGPLKNWIAAVCKYKCTDYLRRHYREACLCSLTEDIPAPEENSAAAELAEELLESLAPPDRELFRRYYLEECSVEKIAAEKSKSPAYLYNRLSLGRKRLKSLFKERNL